MLKLVAFSIGVAFAALINGFLVLFAWNVGLVHAVSAAGGHLGALNFFEAFALYVLVVLVATAGDQSKIKFVSA